MRGHNLLKWRKYTLVVYSRLIHRFRFVAGICAVILEIGADDHVHDENRNFFTFLFRRNFSSCTCHTETTLSDNSRYPSLTLFTSPFTHSFRFQLLPLGPWLLSVWRMASDGGAEGSGTRTDFRQTNCWPPSSTSTELT